jgi:hypothetical protein
MPAKSAAAALSAGASALFEDLSADETLDVDVADAPRSTAAAPTVPAASAPFSFQQPGLYVPPPPSARVDWPATAPGPEEAQGALLRALGGSVEPSTRLEATARMVLESLSELERRVLAGEPQPLDVDPIRKAAVMRVRVAAALTAEPAPGTPVDGAALHAMLGEMDDLLSAVGGLLESAPQELKPSLEAIRNALVKEAIDFSEAAQRNAPAGAAPAGTPGQAARLTGRAAQARVLSISEREEPESRGPLIGWMLLGFALVAAGGFHGYRYWARKQLMASRPTLPGQPAGMVLVSAARGAPQVLIPLKGASVDPVEIERFKAQQRAKGLEVEELMGGALSIRKQTDKARSPP